MLIWALATFVFHFFNILIFYLYYNYQNTEYLSRLYVNMTKQRDLLFKEEELNQSQRVNLFIYMQIVQSGYLVFFLGLYYGALARNKKHGM